MGMLFIVEDSNSSVGRAPDFNLGHAWVRVLLTIIWNFVDGFAVVDFSHTSKCLLLVLLGV